MGASRAAPAAHLKVLEDLIEDFHERLGPEGDLEAGYIDWMRRAPSLATAVDRAVRSRKPDGKMHNHQSRIPLRVLLSYGDRLIREFEGQPPWDFHELLSRCTHRAVRGIGPVTAYDVTCRLAAWYDLEPDRVYLHAGVKAGAEALGIQTRGKEWLTMDEFPKAMQGLTPDETEDFLCVYRTLFPNLERTW